MAAHAVVEDAVEAGLEGVPALEYFACLETKDIDELEDHFDRRALDDRVTHDQFRDILFLAGVTITDDQYAVLVNRLDYKNKGRIKFKHIANLFHRLNRAFRIIGSEEATKMSTGTAPLLDFITGDFPKSKRAAMKEAFQTCGIKGAVSADGLMRALRSLDVPTSNEQASCLMDMFETESEGEATYREFADGLYDIRAAIQTAFDLGVGTARQLQKSLSLSEFRETMNEKMADEEAQVRAIFDMCDRTGRGIVELHVLSRVMKENGVNTATNEYATFLREVDDDNDGLITFANLLHGYRVFSGGVETDNSIINDSGLVSPKSRDEFWIEGVDDLTKETEKEMKEKDKIIKSLEKEIRSLEKELDKVYGKLDKRDQANEALQGEVTDLRAQLKHEKKRTAKLKKESKNKMARSDVDERESLLHQSSEYSEEAVCFCC